MDESIDRRDALRAIEACRNGEFGVPYSALRRFARPIFELYGIDSADVHEAVPARELLDHLSVMETARLFWWYFGCGAEDDQEITARVKDLLIGDSPMLEQEAVFATLVEQLRQNWHLIPVALRHTNGHACTTESLGRLLDDLECQNPEASPAQEDSERSEGAVDSPDALAVFASPLLEDPSVEDDPDRVYEMMARARDYWQLAQLEDRLYESQLRALANRYASTDEGRRRVLAEATMMVARFHMLFPHWTRGGGES